MSPQTLTVRLPSGSEYWFTDNVPAVGESLSHAGARYLVVSCENEGDDRFVVTLKAEEDRDQETAASPIIPVSPV